MVVTACLFLLVHSSDGKKTPTYDPSVWYYMQSPNKLSQMVPTCKLGDIISGHKTNHSLSTTGVTELYEAEVPQI